MAKTFKELGLSEKLLKAVKALEYQKPSPIQEQAIPVILEGKDLIASAQTGTGKTAAFMLPTLQRMQSMRRGKKPVALIISPTRELAQQIERMTQIAAQITKDRIVTIVGGASYKKQISQLKAGCDIVVATPGRLIDLIDKKLINLRYIKILALDEADRMLDMGFWPSVKQIIAKVPEKRQTLLFSATISGDIQNSIPRILRNPVTIEISPSGTTAETVDEYIIPVVQGQKVELLVHLLKDHSNARALIFCRTKNRVDSIAKRLKENSYRTEIMHADRHQRQRERALKNFDSGKTNLLVATDVMSRGIDVSDIDIVINFDVPLDPEDYVHRVGRTGRAGEKGLALTFVGPDEITPLREIEYFTEEILEQFPLEDFNFDDNRIEPNPSRSAKRPVRSVFRGSRRGGPGFGLHGRYR